MSLRMIAQAKAEVRSAANWYEREREGLGDDFVADIKVALDAIERSPEIYPRIETTRTKRNVRRYLMRRFPYTLVYELRQDEIIVVAVSHARRRPNYWLRRRTDEG
ncbi:MAG TPA: type II toxin-antitoxin system RelE/ParE family toxin [Pirellulales bacterium]|nr:type II toxin-antitoxin system RelE/ParE family toxin [Pirellulales bacterium]